MYDIKKHFDLKDQNAHSKMEEFEKYGFYSLSDDQIEELTRGNPNVSPYLQRYKGMGWVELIVKYKPNQIAPGINLERYMLTYVGGENGYTAEDNFEKYIQLNSESPWSTLDEILNKTKSESWIEVEKKCEYENATVLHCIERKNTSN